MNTNWPDVFVVLAIGAVMCGLFAIGAWLVTKDHPWFALLVFIAASGVRIKTGS